MERDRHRPGATSGQKIFNGQETVSRQPVSMGQHMAWEQVFKLWGRDYNKNKQGEGRSQDHISWTPGKFYGRTWVLRKKGKTSRYQTMGINLCQLQGGYRRLNSEL